MTDARLRTRDRLAAYNERVKLFATFLDATGLGLLGFALLGPATEDIATLDGSAALWSTVGLALHLVAHHVLGSIHEEFDHDDP